MEDKYYEVEQLEMAEGKNVINNYVNKWVEDYGWTKTTSFQSFNRLDYIEERD